MAIPRTQQVIPDRAIAVLSSLHAGMETMFQDYRKSQHCNKNKSVMYVVLHVMNKTSYSSAILGKLMILSHRPYNSLSGTRVFYGFYGYFMTLRVLLNVLCIGFKTHVPHYVKTT